MGPEPPPWRLVLPLRVITPIVGGGVEAMEPDTVDIVRLPEVRGVLRWWWRALYAGEAEEPDALFQREAALWGGVDVPAGPEKTSYRSRVRLQSRILSPGRVVPAGTHQPGRDGKPRAFPTWTLGKGLGYALFPLQRTTDERRKFRGQAMPTRAVRTGVRFELSVAVVAPPRPKDETDEGKRQRLQARWPDEIREVLQTLWAWIHLGGLGARTRRGFGALALDGDARVGEGFPGPEDAAALLAEDLAAGWRRLQGLNRLGPRLAGARLLVGPEARDAAAAHEALVSALWTFRQGVGFAREAGKGRPGHSRWPEAEHLRRLNEGRAEGGGDPGEEPGVPRAAFGMPLIVQFKDAKDRGAGATIVPAGERGDAEADGARWASPVLLRPSASGPAGYRPQVLLLGGDRPHGGPGQRAGRPVAAGSGAHRERRRRPGRAQATSRGRERRRRQGLRDLARDERRLPGRGPGRAALVSGRWLLDVGLGPVGRFIAAGRRSRDLWWGSTWVSECTRQTAKWLHDERGAELLVPTWKRVEEVGEKSDKGDSLTYSGRVTNRIRCLVTAGGPDEVAEVARGAEEAARRVLAGLIRRSVGLEGLENEQRTKQERESAQARSQRIRGWLREVLDQRAFARQLEAIEKGDDFLEVFAVWTPVKMEEFRDAYTRADELLTARKGARLFDLPEWTEPGHPKSDLDAGRDSVLKSTPDRRTGQRSEASSTARRRLGIGPDEGLDAVGLARRIAALTRGPMLQPLPFPPLGRIAADAWIEKAATDSSCEKAFSALKGTLKEEKDRSPEGLFFLWCSPARDPAEPVAKPLAGEGIFRYDASLLFEGGLEAEWAKIDRLKKQGAEGLAEIEHALEVLEDLREPIDFLQKRLGLPPAYYALLQMDGDGVGSALGKAPGPTELQECVHALERFADKAETILRNHHGCAFYIGGDDLAAYVPVDTVTRAARDLALEFATEVAPTFRQHGLGEVSLSGGIVLAHVKSDLRGVRRQAHEALDEAKRRRREAGSDAAWLEVRDVPRSGSPRACHGELGKLVNDLERWVELLGKKELSLRSAHALLELVERFAEEDGDGGILGLELARARLAAQQARSTKATSSAVPDRVAEAKTWGEVKRFAVELLAADRIYDTRKLRPRDAQDEPDTETVP